MPFHFSPPLLPSPMFTHSDSSDLMPFHLSIDAILGSPSPRTLCLYGLIHEHSISVLVDLESSHNIIQPRVTQFLSLPVVALLPFSVLVGNGDSLQCSGFVTDVRLTL